ncbi:ATP-grasp peptide maturase system methyltransferase [Streptomyces sp. 8N616]|uniref:ATP-grasp peptide maturase system methyltransferase n=1 Tax=Streptomyces sp. 8N616 TaxID=3457414 RepID=UPI003FD06BE5
MNLPDTSRHRRALAARLIAQGHLKSPAWKAAVEAVPRELFLSSGVFLPEEATGLWRPITPDGMDPEQWTALAYSDQSLVTQLDGRLTPDQADSAVSGFPTSSSTLPATVVGMLEALDVEDGQNAAEIGTGTGYSTALMCHRLGEDSVTSIEVDPRVAERADASLETAGYSTWTVTGDGLLGNPRRAPYDRIIATCAVRRIPYTWIRQTRPGGIILATVGPGSWSYGTGLAKLTVKDDGTAEGRIIGPSSFMPARSQAVVPVSGDLAACTAYADTERKAIIEPDRLNEWMPAFLAQLAAPGQLVRAVAGGGQETVYLFDTSRESFAALTADAGEWTVRQGGPLAIWDAIEGAVAAWRDAGEPDISAVRVEVSPHAHVYWIGGQQMATPNRSYWIGDNPALRWEHRHQPLTT